MSGKFRYNSTGQAIDGKGKFVRMYLSGTRYQRMKQNYRQMTLRFDLEDAELIKKYAAKNKVTVAEYVRCCVQWQFENENA